MPTLQELVQSTKQKLGYNDAEIVWCLLQSDHPENGVTDDEVATAAYTYFNENIWGKQDFRSVGLIDKVLEFIPYLQLQGDAFRSAFDKFSKMFAGCGISELGSSSITAVRALTSCCLLDSIPLKKVRAFGISVSEECNLTFGDLIAAAVMSGPIPPQFNAGTFLRLFCEASSSECNWEDLNRIRYNLSSGTTRALGDLQTTRQVAGYFPGYVAPKESGNGTALNDSGRVPPLPWVRGTWQEIGAAAKHIARWNKGKWYRFAETSDGYVSIIFSPVAECSPDCAVELGLPYKDWAAFCADCAATGKQSVTVVFNYKPHKEAEMFTVDPITWHTKGLRAILDMERDLMGWCNLDALGKHCWNVSQPIIGADGSIQLDTDDKDMLYADADGNLHCILGGHPDYGALRWTMWCDLGESSEFRFKAKVPWGEVSDCIELIKRVAGVYMPALAGLSLPYTFSGPSISVEVDRDRGDGVVVRITRKFPGVRFDVLGEIERSASKLAQWSVFNDKVTDGWHRIAAADDFGIKITTDIKELLPCKATVDGYDIYIGWEYAWLNILKRKHNE